MMTDITLATYTPSRGIGGIGNMSSFHSAMTFGYAVMLDHGH